MLYSIKRTLLGTPIRVHECQGSARVVAIANQDWQ